MSYRDELIRAFITHYDALRRRAEGYVRSPQLAADIVQDCYLRIIEHDPAVRVENPLAFLHRVVGNLAIDRQREAALHARRVQPGSIPEEVLSTTPSAFQIVAGEQEYDLLRQAIEQLPAKCREVFLLYRTREMTMNEIARLLGISPRTVENHLAYAMKHCRKALQRPPV
ncbi:MAG: sigma-70 family RNA polymerase sigma factor [Gammaproteobacteria bacterium]